MTAIAGLQETVRTIADRVGGSVVGVAGRRSEGSGLVVAPGRILTNAHNLWGSAVEVRFSDGRTEQAQADGVDVEGDVAVLEADTKDAEPIAWPIVQKESSTVEIGAAVFAVANPGGRGLRVTFGLVSGTERAFRGPRGRQIAGSIEHTAPLLPGSSGSPIVDDDGNLLGVNTHRLGDGFYLAIPADEQLRLRIDALARGEAPTYLRLGVALASGEVATRLRRSVGLPQVDGVLVRGVQEDGAAAAAGIREGDLLTTAGGKALRTSDDLLAALEASASSKKLEIRFLRGAEEKSITVEFTG